MILYSLIDSHCNCNSRLRFNQEDEIHCLRFSACGSGVGLRASQGQFSRVYTTEASKFRQVAGSHQHQTPFHSKEFWETRPDADKFPVNALLLIDCGLPEDHKN